MMVLNQEIFKLFFHDIHDLKRHAKIEATLHHHVEIDFSNPSLESSYQDIERFKKSTQKLGIGTFGLFSHKPLTEAVPVPEQDLQIKKTPK